MKAIKANKASKAAAKAILLLLALLSVGSAVAGPRHGHGVYRGNVGIVVGPAWRPHYPPAWEPGYFPPTYPYPWYYAPPIVIERTLPPPIYIEQSTMSHTPAPAANDWYYCASAQAYYPYVKECPAGWQRVPPYPQDKP